MSYRHTDVPDSTTVQITLSVKQVKQLNQLAELDLVEAETYGISAFPESELQRLIDVFWPILHIKLTEAEAQAKAHESRRKWANSELNAVEGL